MKLLLIHLTLFLATAFLADEPLRLNPGDVWTNSFNTLPFTGTTSSSGAGTSYGSLQMNFNIFGNGATLRYEMFEGVLAGGDAARSGLITAGGNFSATQSFLWQDLNGSVRLTMLTGECTVGSVAYGVGKPFPENPLTQVDTYIGGASLTSPPVRLVITRLSNVLELSFWTNINASYLESANVLNSNFWVSPTQQIHLVGNRWVYRVDPFGQSYFRLIRFYH